MPQSQGLVWVKYVGRRWLIGGITTACLWKEVSLTQWEQSLQEQGRSYLLFVIISLMISKEFEERQNWSWSCQAIGKLIRLRGSSYKQVLHCSYCGIGMSLDDIGMAHQQWSLLNLLYCRCHLMLCLSTSNWLLQPSIPTMWSWKIAFGKLRHLYHFISIYMQ